MADENQNQAVQEFVQQLTGCQPRLYAYIMTLVLDPHDADDVLQQVNLVMWNKLDEFLECKSFDALACRVAYYQVMAHRRDQFRERRRLLFDDQLIENLAETANSKTDGFQGYLTALHDCLAKLPDVQRELVCKRYEPGGSVNGIAADNGDSPNSVSASLYRIRKLLLACIRENLAKDLDR
jgi:RNA polymerase sigma-70 factor, ECF subfamily